MAAPAGTMPPMAPPGMYGAPMAPKRPIGVTILAVLTIIFGLLGLLGGILLVIVFAAAATVLPAEHQGVAGILLALAAFVTILSLVALISGVGVLRLRAWRWWAPDFARRPTRSGEFPRYRGPDPGRFARIRRGRPPDARAEGRGCPRLTASRSGRFSTVAAMRL